MLTIGLTLTTSLAARGEVYELTVVPAESLLEMAPSHFDGFEFVPAEPQATNSLRARLTGTVRLEVTNNTAQLLAGTELSAENSGDWYPGVFTYNPNSPRSFNTNTDPANFGYIYTNVFSSGQTDISVAIRNMRFSLAHAEAVEFIGSSFVSAGAVAQYTAGTADLDMGNPPQSVLTYFPTGITVGETNIAQLVEAGGSVTLTLPVHFVITLVGPVLTQTEHTAVIVARSGMIPQPELAIALITGGIELSWPQASTGFGLTTSTNLSATVWSPVAATPVVESGRWRVTVAPVADQHYFRLEHP